MEGVKLLIFKYKVVVRGNEIFGCFIMGNGIYLNFRVVSI